METPKEGMIMESPSKDSISIYKNGEWVIYHSASSIKDLASAQITALQSRKDKLERFVADVARGQNGELKGSFIIRIMNQAKKLLHEGN